ncbi:MAG: inositol monophosphatase [Bacteroidales bacterium]|nr:inositol monophosphatase [Bacteroidales bacterium]
MNYSIITQQVVILCREVGKFIKVESGRIKQSDIEEKGLHDLVSYVDKTAEQMLIDALKKMVPEAGFIAEESGIVESATYRWIIDPLDGTTNFIHKIPLYSISIALQMNGITMLGVVYEINQDECFYASHDGIAYLNGSPIHVSQTSTLSDSLIATGFPYYDFSRLKPYLAFFENLITNTRGIRRLGSAAVDLVYVACGRFEAFYEYGLHPWDVAAGAFIVERAGGKLSGFDGESDVVFGKDILATNGLVHKEILDKIASHFKPAV